MVRRGRNSFGGHSLLRKNATMKLSRSIWVWGIALMGLIILLAPVPAFAQSCALCYTQAASSGSRMIQALKSGILILIVPPTLGSIGMIFVVYHKRNQVRRTESGDESRQDW
jgi:hypothetical protein